MRGQRIIANVAEIQRDKDWASATTAERTKALRRRRLPGPARRRT